MIIAQLIRLQIVQRLVLSNVQTLYSISEKFVFPDYRGTLPRLQKDILLYNYQPLIHTVHLVLVQDLIIQLPTNLILPHSVMSLPAELF